MTIGRIDALLRAVCGPGLALLVCAAPLAALAAEPGPDHRPVSPSLAAALARQAASCVARRDTDHAAFHGCIDWHSAVHGAWALVAYQLGTGDRRHAALVGRNLEPSAVAREAALLSVRPRFEMPYGRAWFLRLALDHHRLTGKPLLTAMADRQAAAILDHLDATGADPLRGSYASASWALINVVDYARHRGLKAVEARAIAMVRRAYLGDDATCDYGLETGHFMAVCTNWAALVARVLPTPRYRRWLFGFLKRSGLPDPVTRPVNAHHYGLNFSRAWGLWDIYAATGRQDVLRAYIRHFQAGFRPRTNWAGDYRRVGHWVAQFGMFALQPQFGRDRGR